MVELFLKFLCFIKNTNKMDYYLKLQKPPPKIIPTIDNKVY